MDESAILKGFDGVWARVTEKQDFEVPTVPEEIKSGEKLCLIPLAERSRAVRFIPDI